MAEYIEREALLKEVDDLKKSPWYNDDYGFGTRQARHDGVECVVDLCIKQAPTADVVEVVHGKWERVRKLNVAVNPYQHTCGVCGKSYFDHNENNYPYCPYCGAKMDGDKK
jgi:hypothetical protein